jgi:hypothetical protein
VIDSDHRFAPISALNAQTTTVIRRTQLMFSPAKAIVAGALVLATWGVLSPQPSEAQGGSPGPVIEEVAPTWVTGTIQPVDGTCSRLESKVDGGVSRSAYTCTQTWASSDPRLSGRVSKSWSEDTYQTGEGPISVGIDAPSLRNDDGGWRCSYGYVAQGSTPATQPLTESTFTCVGEGGYEGLTAVLVSRQVAGFFAEEFAGIIFSGDLPAVPAAPASEGVASPGA